MQKKAGKVLLAEDNADDLAFVHLAFRKIGMERSLVIVSDGAQAISYLRGDGPYADRTKFPIPVWLLLNLWLPRVDGFEVLKWVRTRSNLRRLPITVFTGPDYPQDVTRGYVLGANAFLSKPFDPCEFNDSLRDIGERWLNWCKLQRAFNKNGARNRTERSARKTTSTPDRFWASIPTQDRSSSECPSRKRKGGQSLSPRLAWLQE
jgi:CheY-like chemotaxis protein